MTRFILKRMLFIILLCVNFSIAMQTSTVTKNTPLAALYEHILQQKFSDPKGANVNAELLLQRSQKEENLEFIFKAYYQLARIANIQGDHKTGLHYAEKAIQAAENTENNVFLSKALLTKGNVYVYLGDDDVALKNYLKALKQAKESKDPLCQIMARASLAKVKRNVHFNEEALKMYQENFKLCKQYGFEKQTIGIDTYLGLTGTFLTLKQPDSTLFYAQPGLLNASQNKDAEGESYFYIDMGIAYYMKSEFKKAIDNLKKAAEITLQLKNKKRLTEVYYYIGKSYAGLENYDAAVRYLELTKKTISQENSSQNTLKFNPHILLKTHETLAEIYKVLGEFEKSNNSFEQYKTLDKLKDVDRTNVYETLLDNATKENAVLTSSESRLKGTLKLISIITIAILLCCFYFIWRFISIRKKNKIIFEQLVARIEQESKQKKKADVTIQDEKVNEILMRLDKLETTLFFLNSNCSLQNVAKKLKTNTSYLSKIIGTHKQKKFTEYINELRIQYVLKRLKEDLKFRKYAIKNIAEEIGYKSTNSFTKHFKAHTKLYPSFYIQNLNEKEKEESANL